MSEVRAHSSLKTFKWRMYSRLSSTIRDLLWRARQEEPLWCSYTRDDEGGTRC